MKIIFHRLKIPVVFSLFLILIVFLFRPVFFQHKTLFPANLMVSTYVPWKYEPFSGYPNGPANKPMGFDDIRQFLPNRKILREEFNKLSIPLWNPYIYSGTPFMGAFDTAVWYPLSWIAIAVPLMAGWDFLVIIQPILSFVFMCLFLRSMKFDMRIVAFGAFAYALSGWMIVYKHERSGRISKGNLDHFSWINLSGG